MPVTKYTPTDHLQKIAVGDSVILTVKQLLPNGAGNQQFDYYRNNNNSTRFTGLVQKCYGADWYRPLRNAGAALKFGAGNCQEQASVAYALLRERLNNSTFASFCVSWDYKHSFATIGNPLTDNPRDVIVVDPWPQLAQAVLQEDHFVADRPIDVLRSKVGGKTDRIAKARAKYPQNVDKDIVMSMFEHYPPPPYNQLYCAKINDIINYTDDLISL